MRTLFLAAISAAAFAGLACAQDSEQRDLTGFDAVNAGGGYHLIVTVGEDWSVRLEGDAEDFADLESSVIEGELRLRQHQRMFHRSRHLDVTVHVTLPAISELDFNRGIDAEASGIAADTLSVEVSTGASATLTGTCGTGEFDLSTGSALNARELICGTAEVEVSTGASARIHADVSVRARASTGGAVTVHGSPSNRDARSSMGGSVRFNTAD
tara:strand:- start:3191 stop:3829 length:639 start_codon:yes stop_codon:yes gene_type:complete